jgi:hypothetical protein
MAAVTLNIVDPRTGAQYTATSDAPLEVTFSDSVVTALEALTAAIQQLAAGQGVPLPQADETAIKAAMAGVTTAVAGTAGSAAALTGLEPPATPAATTKRRAKSKGVQQ